MWGYRQRKPFDRSRLFLSALALTLLIACVLETIATAVAEEVAIRVMPLGNSITQGYSNSYRRPLWIALQEAGIKVDFVGSMSHGYSGQDEYDDYDPDHEGHWGWFSDEALGRIDEWAIGNDPDVVLIHLGTNDIGSGQQVAQTVHEIEQIIDRLRAHNSGVHIILAAIIPVDHAPTSRRIAEFNQHLSNLARDLNSTPSRVLLVDQFAGFDPAVDTYDGIHPNEQGNEKMAAKWFAAMKSLLTYE